MAFLSCHKTYTLMDKTIMVNETGPRTANNSFAIGTQASILQRIGVSFMKVKISEKEIENQILDWLKIHHIFAWKNQSVGVFDPTKKVFRMNRSPHHLKGVSDILGFLPNGKFLAIEVKTQTGRVTPEQQSFIDQVNALGNVAFVARSLDDVLKRFPESRQK